jgi:hypothetical protein
MINIIKYSNFFNKHYYNIFNKYHAILRKILLLLLLLYILRKYDLFKKKQESLGKQWAIG